MPRSLAPHKVDAHNGRPVKKRKDRKDCSADADGTVALIHCRAATSEKLTTFAGITIGHNMWMQR
jgi:hypothetical protein